MDWKIAIPGWETIENISNEMIIAHVKLWRKEQLSKSDYTQLPDVDLVNKFDWAVYRQELRDLPQQGSNPKLWVFPDPPK